MIDRHYTPNDLAERALAASCAEFTPETAADFTAGEGALLVAVRRRWKNCNVVANDIDQKALSKLSQRLDGAALAACDFLSSRSRSASPVLRLAKETGIDLVVLNPPFSNRGGKRYTVRYRNETLACGRAMAFVMTALSYVSARGRLLAILPTSCLTSERDAAAVAVIQRHFRLTEVIPRTKESFRGCSVEVTGILIEPSGRAGIEGSRNALPPMPAHQFIATLYRGTIPAKLAATCGNPCIFVHTTHLRNGQVDTSLVRNLDPTYVVERPSVLVPRVGRPNSGKICIVDGRQPIVLSDCVFAISLETLAMAETVKNTLLSRWNDLSALYVGSCAPYLTRTKLQQFLRDVGVDSVVARGSEFTKLRVEALAA